MDLGFEFVYHCFERIILFLENADTPYLETVVDVLTIGYCSYSSLQLAKLILETSTLDFFFMEIFVEKLEFYILFNDSLVKFLALLHFCV